MSTASFQNEDLLAPLQVSGLTSLPAYVLPVSGQTVLHDFGPSLERTDFLGILRIPGVIYPAQRWTAAFDEHGATFENHPEHQWPKVRIVFQSDAPLGAERALNFFSHLPALVVRDLSIAPTADTAEAEVLYTRVFLALVIAGRSTLQDLQGREVFSLRHDGLAATDRETLLDRAKLYRKIRFIEIALNTRFELPSSEVTADEVRLTESVFNGITQGVSLNRGSDITVKAVPLSEIEVTQPPFTAPGEFRRAVSWGSKYLGLFGKALDVGPVILVLKHSEIADPRVIDKAPKGSSDNVDLRFVVYDHQILHRFERYVQHPLTDQLEAFATALRGEEPREIADLVFEPLSKEVPARQAIQIATGWLYINSLPDRYSPQAPDLEAKGQYWRVPIHLVYANGKNGAVGELRIDLRTGKILDHTPIDELRRNGKVLAETLLHA